MKLIVKLKQHTPLIHFQHDQDGATLRASELKPKLDKFIIENVFEGDRKKYGRYTIGYNKEKNLIKNGMKSLNYKVKINSYEANEVEMFKRNKMGRIEKNYPLFFGNMSTNEVEKKFTMYSKVEIEFFSFDSSLIEYIKNELPEFLFKTNFGTRQNKGFGSFFLDDKLTYIQDGKEYNYEREKIEAIKNNNKYKFNLLIKNTDKYRILFSNLETFYKSLRSGINRESRDVKINFYCKPAIYYYANSKKLSWDKKIIKNSGSIKRNNLEKITLIKDILGLSTIENWKTYKKNNVRMSFLKNIADIQRYKSPITFKIIEENKGYDIYILIDEKKELLNRLKKEEINITFNMEGEYELNDKNKILVKNLKKLNIADEVSVVDFFRYVFENDSFDYIKNIGKGYSETTSYKLLKSIYNQIKENARKVGDKND